jgi:hypothetical protein
MPVRNMNSSTSGTWRRIAPSLGDVVARASEAAARDPMLTTLRTGGEVPLITNACFHA